METRLPTTELLTKPALLDQCREFVRQRIDAARQAMETAQESANSESKSSAGDKYETGRAMAQLDRDRYAQQLAEARKLDQDLARINIDKAYTIVQPGSLVLTSRGAFFISISAGKLTVDGHDYVAVSPASPIATVLAGKKAGDTVVFNKVTYQILDVA